MFLELTHSSLIVNLWSKRCWDASSSLIFRPPSRPTYLLPLASITQGEENGHDVGPLEGKQSALEKVACPEYAITLSLFEI